MVMVAVRGVCVCVGGRVVGWGCDVIFNITAGGGGGLELIFFCFGGGYCLSFC